jgi:excisionase family DNA binding protein
MIQETLLTPTEVSKRLRISTRTLNRYMNDGRIPYIKIRRSIRFFPDSIDYVLRSLEVPCR